MAQFGLLGLSGSLRRASNSTAVLHGLLDALAPKAALKIFPLHGVPLYNEDDDDGEHVPEQVRALRSAIASSDGVIMISPEYNHGMSGVLKNALDWASRPHGRSAPQEQARFDDDGLARLHWRRACAAADERDTCIDPCTPCPPTSDRDRRRA